MTHLALLSTILAHRNPSTKICAQLLKRRLSWGSSAIGRENIYGTTFNSMLINYFELELSVIKLELL
ncbi:hypothetical protein NC653_037730 [Populus alba x Populus x berolinensis]|uniref:Uncharacterized protein n=1 Tax=Populus alba x Populus x berolinensis TaxID=444605 RepID=A0AAD6LEY6_9ROSI|nr:hypothetical protein NC653_037730 [Populus alba x Populus x berolinensis]